MLVSTDEECISAHEIWEQHLWFHWAQCSCSEKWWKQTPLSHAGVHYGNTKQFMVMCNPWQQMRVHTTLSLSHALMKQALPRLASLKSLHLPGVLNSVADSLSRIFLKPGEGWLNQEVVQKIRDPYVMASVKISASSKSTHCHMWFFHTAKEYAKGLDSTWLAELSTVRLNFESISETIKLF